VASHTHAGLLDPLHPGIPEKLKHSDQLVSPDYPFELKAGALARRPNQMGFYKAYDGQSDRNTLAARERDLALAHEAVRRYVDDVHFKIAYRAMLGKGAIIDGVSLRTTPFEIWILDVTRHRIFL
jgi:hypothetical protein